MSVFRVWFLEGKNRDLMPEPPWSEKLCPNSQCSESFTELVSSLGRRIECLKRIIDSKIQTGQAGCSKREFEVCKRSSTWTFNQEEIPIIIMSKNRSAADSNEFCSINLACGVFFDYKSSTETICGHIHVLRYVCIYIYIYIFKYVYIYIYTHICVYIYIHIHILKYHTYFNVYTHIFECRTVLKSFVGSV